MTADPLDVLRKLRHDRGSVFTRRRGEIYVSDPVLAKEILANNDGLFREHSDFFRIRTGMFAPRSAQVEIGRAARVLLRRYAAAHAGELPALVSRLAPGGDWPDAGNRLVYEHFRPALIGDTPSAALRETVDQVVERAVLAGARERYSRLARHRFRARVTRVLGAELAARRARRPAEPADLLDVVADAATARTRDADLAEVFLSCLFAVAGSVGFLLGWSLYLVGTAASEPAHPAWVVREALRLWPVAWQFGRVPTREHQLASHTAKPADEVVVCSYLVHRDPAHWSEPDEFRPDRWASGAGQEAFIPFGWGPHACTGAGVATQVVEALVGLITSAYRLEVAAASPRPQVSAALAPPKFTLVLVSLPEGR
ncbi:Cytochrome P450 [Amycolatopsis xylanica]|uniref:Cytochrome P450 n=1 Tax=Amycolatopsis xylanica TaxID=589385 RepID=A0A1H3PMG1_9PSEU|nr:cytochrome P450 [Amycolatopsis xylanica]SDZ02223.1 Cytochrome P450 [Amycolatopsis xylanica]